MQGFTSAVTNLRDFVPAVYDVTVAVPKESPAPTMKRLLGGQPSVVIFKHSHAKHTSIDFKLYLNMQYETGLCQIMISVNLSNLCFELREINLYYNLYYRKHSYDLFMNVAAIFCVFERSKHLQHCDINVMLANVVINKMR